MAAEQHRRNALATGACAEMCGERAGHRLSALRLRLASATPSGWRDALVVSAQEDGTVLLAGLEDGAPTELWHHGRIELAVGEPVALHAGYGVLARGEERLSVLVLR